MSLDAKTWLLIALGVVSIFHLGSIAMAVGRHRKASPGERALPTPKGLGIGFITNFFDTLGIGSFAPTTALFRSTKSVTDEKIPGTLNVGHTTPTLIEAFIFISAVRVDPTTLISMIVAATLGAWLGAGVVSRLPKRAIQWGMGGCLLVAAVLMAMTALDKGVTPGEAIGVDGTKLVIAVVGNFILGALMTLGIGLFGPCLILVSLLGMTPKAAFPIMMGSCAFLMPVASLQFIRSLRFDLKAALGLIIGGAPAVLIAAFIVKEMPLNAVRWLVVVVVLYTAATLLRSAMVSRAEAAAEA
ncbi:MAG: sulfite exporter TauE/SafE family protein [Gemmatimonadaceae bacterium]|nr:sulfite exporter TauE/SafE family protein [Gemmatimonadaceae bacterium]